MGDANLIRDAAEKSWTHYMWPRYRARELEHLNGDSHSITHLLEMFAVSQGMSKTDALGAVSVLMRHPEVFENELRDIFIKAKFSHYDEYSKHSKAHNKYIKEEVERIKQKNHENEILRKRMKEANDREKARQKETERRIKSVDLKSFTYDVRHKMAKEFIESQIPTLEKGVYRFMANDYIVLLIDGMKKHGGKFEVKMGRTKYVGGFDMSQATKVMSNQQILRDFNHWNSF